MSARTTVIVADDKELFRKTLRSFLKDFQIDILSEAENGLELLKQLETAKPDVVLLDLEMPVLDGSETLTKIKYKFPDQRVIILSMHFDKNLYDNYKARGASGYVPKDAISDRYNGVPTLVKAISEVKNGGNFFFEKCPPGPDFSKRQLDIVRSTLKGLTSEEIALKLDVTTRAIDKQKATIYKIVGGNKVVHLYLYAIAKGYQFLGETD
jgi:DNA-binding NarL/FixJ family response regulator